MKINCIILCLALSLITAAAQVDRDKTVFHVVQRNANSSVWERTEYETGPSGKSVPHIHKYTELATGLNHLVNGQWVASKEEIDILPDGTAAATNGQHQAYFPADIYTGAIKLITPDGKTLQSQPVALSYDDGSNTVLIAAITNSTGYVANSNQVIYPNAFVGLNADMRYTYRKSGFEQDVILHEQPPTPTSLGLNPQTTKLQVLTEFFNSPQPSITRRQLHTKQGQTADDEDLTFGSMTMVPGKAFSLGHDRQARKVHVHKEWVQIQSRQFLVEEVPIAEVAGELETLPPSITQTKINKSTAALAKRFILPPQHLAQIQPNAKPIQLTKTPIPIKGYVLDYVAINTSVTNYTFQGDTTYYISGRLATLGTATFEGGTVIKYANAASGAAIWEGTSFIWKGSSYRPIIFTAIDDNSVGETISGSTGAPSGYYANPAIQFYNETSTATHFRISYAEVGFLEGTNASDGQFINCDTAIEYYNFIYPVYITYYRNLLFANDNTGILNNGYYNNGDIVYADSDLQNVTFANVTTALDGWDSSFYVTNCIFANSSVSDGNDAGGDGVIYGNFNGFSNSSGFGDGAIASPIPFQTVGGGSYYLATNSIFHNAGTTNIDPNLLADIETKTTYPPIAYTNVTFNSATTFNPQAQRDNDGLPDLGYHYDPLDYTFGGCTVNSNVTFTAGTAVGWFRTSSGWYHAGYGIHIGDQQTAAFNGTATSPTYWARLNTVQENDQTAGYGPGGLDGQDSGDISQSPVVQANFMKAYMMSAEGNFFRDDYGYLIVNAKNCEFGSGDMGGYVLSLYLTNCLFERAYIGQVSGSAGNAVSIVNGTFNGGEIQMTTTTPIPVRIENCALNGTTVDCTGYGANASYATYDYNAYTNAADPFPTGGTHDVIVTDFDWQSSWFGNYYLPSGSSLIDKGNPTANLAGLYYYTTQTNQVLEGNSPVDIGYHYVANGPDGNPYNSDADGIPNYLEDTDPNNPTAGVLKVIIDSPANGTILQ